MRNAHGIWDAADSPTHQRPQGTRHPPSTCLLATTLSSAPIRGHGAHPAFSQTSPNTNIIPPTYPRVRPALQQRLHHVGLPQEGGTPQRRALELALAVGVCAAREQQLRPVHRLVRLLVLFRWLVRL